MVTGGGGKNQKQMSILLTAKNLTKKAWKSFTTDGGRSIKVLRQGFKGLQASVIAFAAAIGATATAALKKMIDLTKELSMNAIDTASTFEQLEIQFGFLFQSAKIGKKKLDDLWEVASELPFTIKEIAKSAKLLKVWGVVGKDIQATMTAIADITALSGERMELVSRVIGRAWQQGRFLTRGPGLMIQGLMRTKMGFDATKASVQEFRMALARLMIDPQFGIAGMSKSLAKTFAGIKSMISDAITNIERTLAGAGMFDHVKEFAEDIRQWLKSEPLLKRIRLLGRVISSVVEKAKDKFNELLESGKVDEFVDDWIDNIKQVRDIIFALIDNAPVITKIIMNISESIGRAFNMAIKSMSGIIKLLETVGVLESLESAAGGVNKKLKKQRGVVDSLTAGYRDWSEYVTKLKNAKGNLAQKTAQIATSFSKFTATLKVAGVNVDDYNDKLSQVKNAFILVRKAGGEVGAKALFREATVLSVKLWEQILKDEKLSTAELDKRYLLLKKQASASDDLSASLEEQLGFLKAMADPVLVLREESEIFGENVYDWRKELNDAVPIMKTLAIIMGDASAESNKWFFGMKTQAQEIEETIRNAVDLGDEDVEIPFKSIEAQWDNFQKNLIEKWKENGAETVFIMEGVADASASAFDDIFFNLIMNRAVEWKKVWEGFISDIARQISKMVAQKTVAALFIGDSSGGGIPDTGVLGGGGLNPIGGAEQLAGGGLVKGPVGYDNVPIDASAGELLLNKRQQSNLFNMINRGGGGGGGDTYNFNNNISAMDGQDVYRVLERNSDQLVAITRKNSINNAQGIG